ncbi:MAG TPA: TonB family protein [Candidatus Polarisedimenticolia bacterium]|nr:TonB family protein [Candidatus Polarisedimenticolia bacterium]
MPERTTFTSREAALASMLVHALVVIYILLFPETFISHWEAPVRPEDPNAPIPLAFLRSQPDTTEPDSLSLGDAGKQSRSDPRPPSAPPPTNTAPYSAGNTRNRFIAPPIPERAPPSPQPPAPQSPAGEDGQSPAGAPSSQAADQIAPDGRQLLRPKRGEHGSEERSTGRGRGIKDALGKMSLGSSGGAPLKYDNPVGGLTSPQGGLSFDTPGFDWGAYARKIYWIIWTNWTQGWPPAAHAGLAGIVRVHFKIHRDGSITDIVVVDESGTPAFDTCATIALEASSPLPPLPDNFEGDVEGVTAGFFYNTDAPDQ